MTKHLCQGPRCHTYQTQSRVRGTKGNKVLRTRFARYDIGNTNHSWVNNWEYYFCDDRCLLAWLKDNLIQIMSMRPLRNSPLETPVDIVKEMRKGWDDQEYTYTTIKLLNQQTNNDTVNA